MVCGQIPHACKDAFRRHLIAKRDTHNIPEWQLRHNPDYVSSGQIERLWYDDDEAMIQVMRSCGLDWHTYRDVDDFGHHLGFGSGKEGIGLFDIVVKAGGRSLVEYVPFEPGPDSPKQLRNMKYVGLRNLNPVSHPSPETGHVAVSAGLWAKGIIRFSIEMETDFDEAGLMLLVSDLTHLGIGEEYFVSGITYMGTQLKGEIISQGEKERYPVLWLASQSNRWFQMYETGLCHPTP